MTTVGDDGSGWQPSGMSAGFDVSQQGYELNMHGQDGSSAPPTSAAADMARQLAMGGMNTDALLDALASHPKVTLSSQPPPSGVCWG